MSSRISRSSYILGGGTNSLADSSSRIYKTSSSSTSSVGINNNPSSTIASSGYDVRLDPAISSILAGVNGVDFGSPVLNSSRLLGGSLKATNLIISPTEESDILQMSSLGNYGSSSTGLTASNRPSRQRSIQSAYRENLSSRNRSISPEINTLSQLRSQRTIAAVRAADHVAAKAIGGTKSSLLASDITNNIDRPSSASLLMRPNSASSLPTIPSSIMKKQVIPMIHTPTGLSHRQGLRTSSALHDLASVSSLPTNHHHEMLSNSTSKIYQNDNDDDGLIERLRERLMHREQSERLAKLEQQILGTSTNPVLATGPSSFKSIESSLEKDIGSYIGTKTGGIISSPIVSLTSDYKLNTANTGSNGLFSSSTSSKFIQSPTKTNHSGSRMLATSLTNAEKRSIATGTDTPTYHKTYEKFGRTTPPLLHRGKEELALRQSPVKSKNELMQEASEGKIHYCEVHGTLVRSSSQTDLRESGSDVSNFLRSRARHQTLAYGVSPADLGFGRCTNSSKESWTNYRGFNSDMSTKVLREESQSSDAKPTGHNRERNGEVDYKKLYEESQQANTRLSDDLSKVRSELVSSKKKFEEALKVANSGGLTETEKKEKKALEKKLCEMEEELKLLALSENLTDQQLQLLKTENERMKSENRALARVVSKLSTAAASLGNRGNTNH